MKVKKIVLALVVIGVFSKVYAREVDNLSPSCLQSSTTPAQEFGKKVNLRLSTGVALGVSDFDLVAEVLYLTYQNNTCSWSEINRLVRVLSYSDSDRYRYLLLKVDKRRKFSFDPGPMRKYLKKTRYTEVAQYKRVTSSMSEKSALRWSYEYLLATAGADQVLAPVLSDLYSQEGPVGEYTLNLVAEVLYANYENKQYSVNNIVWLLKVLATSGDYSYRTLVGTVDSAWRYKKVRKIVRKYLKEASATTATQYEKNGVDIDFLKDKYISDAVYSDIRLNGLNPKLMDMSEKSTIEDMFSIVGTPQHIDSGSARMNFYYKGQGRAVFGYDPSDGWVFKNIVLDPLAFEVYMPYRDQAEKYELITTQHLLIAMLMSNSASAVKIVAKRIHYHGGGNEELLDSAAELLLSRFYLDESPTHIDAYSWICKMLARRGGRRYKDVLEHVGAVSQRMKLRRYARVRLSDDVDMTDEIYVKGGVSLEDLRVKYPSPYPKLTTTMGRL